MTKFAWRMLMFLIISLGYAMMYAIIRLSIGLSTDFAYLQGMVFAFFVVWALTQED